MNLEYLFKILVIYITLGKILEGVLSYLNTEILKYNGKKLIREKLVHISQLIQLSWITILVYKAFFDSFTSDYILAMVFLSFFILAQLFKLFSILSFGRSWSHHSSILITDENERSGIYRFIKHPHQLGSLIESFALPCFAGFYVIAGAYGLCFLGIFILRLKFEENVIFNYGSRDKALNLKNSNDS